MKHIAALIAAFLGVFFFTSTHENTLAQSSLALTNGSPLQAIDCITFKDAGLSGNRWKCGFLTIPENRGAHS
jgi:hypothetical protein